VCGNEEERKKAAATSERRREENLKGASLDGVRNSQESKSFGLFTESFSFENVNS
jgi:hypothetical protein